MFTDLISSLSALEASFEACNLCDVEISGASLISPTDVKKKFIHFYAHISYTLRRTWRSALDLMKELKIHKSITLLALRKPTV